MNKKRKKRKRSYIILTSPVCINFYYEVALKYYMARLIWISANDKFWMLGCDWLKKFNVSMNW